MGNPRRTSPAGTKVTWQKAGRVTEPGRYMFRFDWLTVAPDDLAIWEAFERVLVRRKTDALHGWMFNGTMKPVLPGAYFTIEVDGTPTVIFHAERLAQAPELTHETWL